MEEIDYPYVDPYGCHYVVGMWNRYECQDRWRGVCYDKGRWENSSRIFSATGNTAKVANTIAASTGGTLFEIKPDQPYTEEDLDYSNSSSRTSQEHADGALRPAYVGDIENWDSYDTIYIGYPIWWGKAPNIVYTFVENHDFQAKKLSPSVPLAVVLSVRVAKNLLKRQKQAIGKKENALAVVSVR